MTATARRCPQAVWLGDEGESVFAFLHEVEAAERRDGAVLIVGPFGWAEMCSYRARRDWAYAFERAGFECARIDLPSSGNSSGHPREPARLVAWTRALASSAEWLRGRGARRVAAVGVGLGGLLALLAAQDGAAIDDFILWGAPARGRTFLREERAFAAVAMAPYEADRRSEPQDGDVERTGFLLSEETVAALEAAEVRPGVCSAARVLLLGRGGIGPDARLEAGLRACGAEVTVADGPDWDELIGRPADTGSPMQTIEASVRWLSERSAAAAPERREPVVPAAGEAVVATGGVRERTLRLPGVLSGSFAVLTECPGRSSGTAVAWLGAGALHHIGPNRLWVQTARRWAARGVPTLRVDMPGMGESRGDVERPIPEDYFYRPERLEEARAVLDELAAAGVAERFVIGGLCSGAYSGLHTALDDPRVVGLLLINLYCFFFSPALAAERHTELSMDAMSGRAWKRLVRGQLSPARVRRAVSELHPARMRRGVTRPVQRSQSAAIEDVLNRLRERRVETLMLLSEGEGLYDQLERQGVLARGGEWPNLLVRQIPSRDHLFRALPLQREVNGLLDQALERALRSGPVQPSETIGADAR